MQSLKSAPEQALEWHLSGRGAVLATVVETWGSAPRRVGAQLVIAGDGEMQGSVSGGCVEGAVVLEATDALKKGEQRLLEYGVSDGDAFADIWTPTIGRCYHWSITTRGIPMILRRPPPRPHPLTDF